MLLEWCYIEKINIIIITSMNMHLPKTNITAEVAYMSRIMKTSKCTTIGTQCVRHGHTYNIGTFYSARARMQNKIGALNRVLCKVL